MNQPVAPLRVFARTLTLTLLFTLRLHSQTSTSTATSIKPVTETVDVSAEAYKAETSTTASRIPLSLMQTPQQLQVITSDLLQSRGSESLKQALEIIPAVGIQLGEGRRDNFYIRGFNAVGDLYLDGIRDDAQYYRDLSNTERIEVLEGPAAVLYGRGSSGGLINRITKKPQLTGSSAEGHLAQLEFTSGSYGQQRGSGDLDTLIPGTAHRAGLRITGAAEHAGSQRHDFWLDRYTFAPTLSWKPDPATDITVQVERLRDDRLPDRGIPFLPGADGTGVPAPVGVGTFYGYVGPQPGSNFIHSAVTDGTLSVSHSWLDGWSTHLTQRLAGYATNFENMYASAVTPVANSNADYLVARGEYHGAQNWRTWLTNAEASRSGQWIGLTHTLLLGTEFGRETTDATQYNGPTNQTPVELFNPQPTAPMLSTVLSRNNRFLGETEAVYAQDLITLSSHWKALLGLRFDNYKQALDLRPPTNTTPNLGRVDNALSPRVGIVYSPRTWSSLYTNYSRTFDPSGENLSLAVNNAQLQPEVTQNYEAGARFDLLRSRLLLSTSLFRLDRTGIKTTDPNNPTALLNLGEQRTDGAELNLQGTLTSRWKVYGGYAWMDGRIVSSTTTSNGVNLQGKRPAITPLHAGSLWTTYAFRNGFGFGGGLVAKDVQFASTDNLARLPGYTRLDVTAFYLRQRYEAHIHIQNIGNIRYFDAAQSDDQIYPAAPINASGTVSWRF